MSRGVVRKHDQIMLTLCPACGRDMALVHRSFFCGSTGCAFGTGSVVDYLVMMQASKSYRAVVDQMMDAFTDRLRPHMDITEEVRSAVTLQLRRQRRVLDFVLRSMRGSGTAKWQHIRAKAQAWKLEDNADRTLMVLEADAVGEFAQLLRDAFPDADLGRIRLQPALVVPWMDSHHGLVSLTWYDPKDLTSRTLDLCDYDVAFSGLLQGGQASSDVHLHRDWMTAARANNFWASGDPARISYGVKLSGFKPATIWLAPRLTYMFDTTHDVTAWLPARLHEQNPTMTVATTLSGARHTWPAFLASMLAQNTNHLRALNFTGTSILSSANPQGSIRNELIRNLRDMEAHEIADQLTRNLFSVEIHKDQSGSLFESPDGYKFSKTGEVGEMVSNFVIRLTSNVVFPESHDTFHSGELMIGEDRYPLLLASRLIDSPKDLQQELQRLASANKTKAVPIIRSLTGWKAATNYLRQMPSRLPTETGTPFLGWNHHKKSFFTPGWRYSMEGCAPAGKLHPGVMLLDCYTASAMPPNEVLETGWLAALPADVASLVAIVMGSIVRGFQDRPCRVVAVRNDRLSGGWLARVFAGFGQTQALPRVERDMGGYLRGMPAYALAADKMSMTLKAPYFVITEYGVRMTTPLDHPAWKWLPDLVSALTRLTVEHILGLAEPTNYARTPRVTYEGEVRDEFSRMAAQDLGLAWPQFVPEYSSTEQFLSGVSPDTVGRVMRYRFASQQLLLDMRQLHKQIDPIDLASELRALCRSCEVKSDEIEIDAHTGLQILNQFYDVPVSLPHC